MTICTLSYPSYHYLHQGLPRGKAKLKEFLKEAAEASKDGRFTEDQLEALKKISDKELIKREEFDQHMSSNEIIVSNWEFVQENSDWKIDAITMRKLKECIMKPFYIRWQFRVKSALASNTDFTKRVLRYDYAGDYILFMLLLNYAIFISFY